MDYIFFTGLTGAIILVLGAAWPESKKITHPTHSVKNWLLGLGVIPMRLYSIFGYMQGGPIFFIFLQVLVAIASVLMMLNTDDRFDFAVITICGLGLIIWSLFLFEGLNTIFFILGLAGIGLGYSFKMGTLRRSIALMLGGALIAFFSYLEANWIFFWLNTFFCLFSAYYVLKEIRKK
jgi:hypothetical protein